ncbi:polyamine-modulated factor 1 [Diretmus argenteus]
MEEKTAEVTHKDTTGNSEDQTGEAPGGTPSLLSSTGAEAPGGTSSLLSSTGAEAPGGTSSSTGAEAPGGTSSSTGAEAPGGTSSSTGAEAPGGTSSSTGAEAPGGTSSSTGAEAPGGTSASTGAEAPRGRLKLFNKVMEKCLTKLIGDASFHRFANTFHPFYKKNPQICKRNPQVMEQIHKNFIEDLQRLIQEDINVLVDEGQLECKLVELDELEKAAKNTDPAWRPSGVPEQDLCSFVMPYYQKQEVFLRQKLKKIQAENAALAQRVQAGRETIAQTEQRIATAADEWKASVRENQRLASPLCPADIFDV